MMNIHFIMSICDIRECMYVWKRYTECDYDDVKNDCNKLILNQVCEETLQAIEQTAAHKETTQIIV